MFYIVGHRLECPPMTTTVDFFVLSVIGKEKVQK
jgi:hypothetical protein